MRVSTRNSIRHLEPPTEAPTCRLAAATWTGASNCNRLHVCLVRIDAWAPGSSLSGASHTATFLCSAWLLRRCHLWDRPPQTLPTVFLAGSRIRQHTKPRHHGDYMPDLGKTPPGLTTETAPSGLSVRLKSTTTNQLCEPNPVVPMRNAKC